MVAGMKEAVKKARLNKPANERIWLWIKDNPDHTVEEISKAMNEDRGIVSGTISQMFFRDMLTRKEDKRPGGGRGSTVLYRYKTNPRLKVFELWPLSEEAKKAKQAEHDRRVNLRLTKEQKTAQVFTLAGTAHLPATVPEPVAEAAPEPVIPRQPAGLTSEQYADLILEHMNAKAAYKLYLVLKEMYEHPERAFAEKATA